MFVVEGGSGTKGRSSKISWVAEHKERSSANRWDGVTKVGSSSCAVYSPLLMGAGNRQMGAELGGQRSNQEGRGLNLTGSQKNSTA